LNLNNIQPPPDGDGEGDADEENNGTSGKNNGEPLEGELCPPDEPIDGDETLTIHDLTAEELHYIRSLEARKEQSRQLAFPPGCQMTAWNPPSCTSSENPV
jgi:hypothetical protein